VAQVIAADAKVTLDEEPALQQPVPRHHSSGSVMSDFNHPSYRGSPLLIPCFGQFWLFGAWGLGLLSGGIVGRGGGGGFGVGGGGGGGFGGFGGGGFGGGGAGGSW